MGFVLVIVGILMIVTGAQGTYAQFGSQVAKDFSGQGNFVYWLASLGIVGSLGYVESLKTISRLLLALIIIAMVLANKGLFAKLQGAIKAGPTAPNPVAGGGDSVQTPNGIPSANAPATKAYNPADFLGPGLKSLFGG